MPVDPHDPLAGSAVYGFKNGAWGFHPVDPDTGGAVGPAGPAGPAGPSGPAGADSTVPGPQGEVGPEGPVGPAGADGDSAYEVAVTGGFVGTEAEWLATLQGEQGIQGEPGIQGEQGIQGVQGAAGLGIAFKGNVATEAELPTGAAQGDLYVVDSPAPARGFVWDETAASWTDAGPVQGPQGIEGPQGVAGEVGPAGPTAISADAGNASRLGTDGLVFTPATDVTAFVKKTGDLMTGQLGFGEAATTPLRFGTAVAGNFNLNMLANEGGLNWQFNASPIIQWGKDYITAKQPLSLLADPAQPLEAATKQYVDSKFSGAGYVLPIATSTVLGGVMVGSGLSISAGGVLTGPGPLLPATTTSLGGIKVGANLAVTADGTLSAAAVALTPATATVLGGVKVGTGLEVTADGVLSSAGYVLPVATSTVLGGVMVGSGLSISAGGVLTGPGPLLPATTTSLGGIKVGANLAVTADGTLSAAAVALTPATATVLGGVKVGTGLEVTADGVLSSTVAGDYLLKTGDQMTGPLRLAPVAAPSTYNGTDWYQYFNETIGLYFHSSTGKNVILRNDGRIVLGAPPLDPMDAATKAFVESAIMPLFPATTTALGGIKVGTGLAVTADGTLSASVVPLTPATATVLGGIKVGTGLTVTTDGTLATTGAPTNPVAGSVAGMKIWSGTQAQYNAIATKDPLCTYSITA